VAAASTLALVHGGADDALWEAVRSGLVFRGDATYRFLHDRVQEAAYATIPEDERAGEHLRIGRLPVAHLPEDWHLSESADQLTRGSALIDDGVERLALARLNVRAGRRAKGAIAYASAQRHLARAAELLPADAWAQHYRETFDLHLVLAECEFLRGD